MNMIDTNCFVQFLASQIRSTNSGKKVFTTNFRTDCDHVRCRSYLGMQCDQMLEWKYGQIMFKSCLKYSHFRFSFKVSLISMDQKAFKHSGYFCQKICSSLHQVSCKWKVMLKKSNVRIYWGHFILCCENCSINTPIAKD